jgi:hypothetical protein
VSKLENSQGVWSEFILAVERHKKRKKKRRQRLFKSSFCALSGLNPVFLHRSGASQFIAGILKSAWTISDGNELEGCLFSSTRHEGAGFPARNPLFQRALILRSSKGRDDLLRPGKASKTTSSALAVYRNTLAVYRLYLGGLSRERRCFWKQTSGLSEILRRFIGLLPAVYRDAAAVYQLPLRGFWRCPGGK